MWLLLSLLVAGAGSYTHGSRYALVPGHDTFQRVGEQGPALAPPRGEAAASPGGPSASASQTVSVVHEVGPFVDREVLPKDRCERQQCPRSEPAPLRTGAADLPCLTRRQHPGDGIVSSVLPPEPDLPALTVVELSISRT